AWRIHRYSTVWSALEIAASRFGTTDTPSRSSASPTIQISGAGSYTWRRTAATAASRSAPSTVVRRTSTFGAVARASFGVCSASGGAEEEVIRSAIVNRTGPMSNILG